MLRCLHDEVLKLEERVSRLEGKPLDNGNSTAEKAEKPCG